MTGEQERYPPPSFSGESETSVSPGDPWTGRRFEASRDWSWNWTQPEPAGPWSSTPGQWNQQPRGHGQQQYRGNAFRYCIKVSVTRSDIVLKCR